MTGPPRVVLDTNVLLDFWVFDDPAARPLRQAYERGEFVALRSDDCDAELADVLGRAEFGLDEQRRAELLAAWTQRAQRIGRVFAGRFGCTDPKDQKFLDTAFSGAATILVSKDRALLNLDRRTRREGLRIVRPQDFFERLADVQASKSALTPTLSH